MSRPVMVRSLRVRLGLDPAGFARLVGVDARTVARWESGESRPTGTSEAVISAIEEKLQESQPEEASAVVAFLVGTVRFGGLAYMLLKLLERVPT